MVKGRPAKRKKPSVKPSVKPWTAQPKRKGPKAWPKAQVSTTSQTTPGVPPGRSRSRPPPTGRSPGGGGGEEGGCPPADRGREGGVRRVSLLSPNQASQHAWLVLYMYMCAMALRLGLVFRLVSPLSGHSHVAGRRGGTTLSPGLDPRRHTSLELYIKNHSPYTIIYGTISLKQNFECCP